MTESPSELGTGSAPINDNYFSSNSRSVPETPIEIVSDEEMTLLEAAPAMASARSCLASSAIPRSSQSPFRSNVRSVQSITALSKRGFPVSKAQPDMEDFGVTQKKIRLPESFLLRFRKKKGLSVTDLTSTEWCEKQMEFSLIGKRMVNEAMKNGIARHAKLEEEEWCEKQMEFSLLGKPIVNEAMKNGIARHAKLEEEVVKKVKVHVQSIEDSWALKLLNFITGVNQLLCEGLTRELPLISYVEGIWMVGVIDEIRMPGAETERNLLLVDTKTRVQSTLPFEAQRRNGRLQLMYYKHMWDNLVANNFHTKKFFDYFSLNPYDILSKEIIEITANLGLPAKTLEDLVRYYVNTCTMLPLAQDQLLLRYECQQDNSLLGEDQFAYDFDWLTKQINGSLEFWRGEREASYTPEEERWKCQFCQFASVCPTNADLKRSSSSPPNSTPPCG